VDGEFLFHTLEADRIAAKWSVSKVKRIERLLAEQIGTVGCCEKPYHGYQFTTGFTASSLETCRQRELEKTAGKQILENAFVMQLRSTVRFRKILARR